MKLRRMKLLWGPLPRSASLRSPFPCTLKQAYKDNGRKWKLLQGSIGIYKGIGHQTEGILGFCRGMSGSRSGIGLQGIGGFKALRGLGLGF